MTDIASFSKFLAEITEAFPAYTFVLNKQGQDLYVAEHWYRIFILHEGCSIGRINFKPTLPKHWLIYGYKSYKPYDYEYSAEDMIFYTLWLKTRKIVDSNIFVEEAKKIRQEKINKILENRQNLVHKRRPKVCQQ